MDTYQPTISVIIPAFNEEQYLPRTIAAIQKAGDRLREERNQTIEIIVVDNNSLDRTKEIATELGAKVIFEQFNNISRARNVGVSHAQGEFLAFIDADMIISDDLLCAIDANLMDSDSVGGGTAIRPERWTVKVAIFWLVEAFMTFLFGGFPGVLHCRKKEFVDMRGFDEKYYVGEKMNFYRRLKLYGKWRSQVLKDTTNGTATVSMRAIAHNNFWTVMFTFLVLMLSPNKRVRDPRYCQMWYQPKR
ncbi:MAG: glycosyltransferase [Verrucomicrobiota bacterium]|nr:glycosyltransferase [Verrucomicrobiota bacterium]